MAPQSVEIPEQIRAAVTSGKCILFLGAMASARSPKQSPYRYQDGERPPSGADLSEYLATRCRYVGGDRRNLANVSLFYEHTTGFGREDLVNNIRQIVSGPNIRISPALRMLAALPFRICITTNYDHLFEIALRDAEVAPGVRKDPVIVVYDPSRDTAAERVPLDPDPQRPIVYKLHGDIDTPNSIVITEEDYITFIAKMATGEGNHPIPYAIRARLRVWPILFIGYSLKDYNLRLLFKTIRMGLDKGEFPLSFSVDPSADKVIVEVFQHDQKRLVDFLTLDLWEFVPALYKAVYDRDYPAASGGTP